MASGPAYSFIGKINGMARVYCCTDEAAYSRRELGSAEKENEVEDDDQDGATGISELFSQITLIYRYTFKTDEPPPR